LKLRSWSQQMGESRESFEDYVKQFKKEEKEILVD
jgi:hypothetical protein